jgi:hypothetical protein
MADDNDAFLNARVRFWLCPVKGHRNRQDRNGWPVVEVGWVADAAFCLFPGCGRTSLEPNRAECTCEEYDCTGECCGAGQCSCTPAVAAAEASAPQSAAGDRDA